MTRVGFKFSTDYLAPKKGCYSSDVSEEHSISSSYKVREFEFSYRGDQLHRIELLSATGKTLKKIESTAVTMPDFLEETLDTKCFTLNHGEHLFGAKVYCHHDKITGVEFLLFRNLYPGKDEAPKTENWKADLKKKKMLEN